MDSVEDLVVELKALTPDQLDRVARIIHELARRANPAGAGDAGMTPQSAIPPAVLDQAVQNGWPAALFTDVIGQVSDDFGKHPADAYEIRRAL
jgi:hypothetical protein